MRLSKRLAAIARLVPQGAVVADIGTGHALLPLHLAGRGISPRVIAGELNPGPLRAAREAVAAAGMAERIEVREGYGLRILQPGEAEVAVISGMGGLSMAEILEASPEVLERLNRLVLQPQGDEALLRRWLMDHHWFLVAEDLVYEDGHFYVIMAAVPAGERPLPDWDDFLLEIGPLLFASRHPLLLDYLEVQKREVEKVLSCLSRASGPAAENRKQLLNKKAEGYRRVIVWLSDAGR